MTEKELKKLNRTELLELLIASYKEKEELKQRLQEAEEKLEARELAIENSGSLAEASLQLNQVFTAAQAAADQYLDNIRSRCVKLDTECQQRERESVEKAKRILEEAEKHSIDMETEARARATAFWEESSAKLREIIDAHNWLQNAFRQDPPYKN